MTSYDLSRPHGISPDQPPVTLAKLMGPQPPLVTLAKLRWLNSYVSFDQRLAENTRCHMRFTKVRRVQLRSSEIG